MNIRLSAKDSFRADLARDAGYLRCKRTELVHHGVDGVFQLPNFSLHIDRDLFRQIAVRHRRRDQRDIAHLGGQITRHEINRVGQVLPGP